MASALFFLCISLVLLLGLSGCDSTESQPHKQPSSRPAYEQFQVGEDMPGGDTSVRVTGFSTFAPPAANMAVTSLTDFHKGNAFFRQPWIPQAQEDNSRDGLGPLFHTNTCDKCHIHDRRGIAPKDGEIIDVSMVVRLSIPAVTEQHQYALKQSGIIPEPVYGGQLQDLAIEGVRPEGKARAQFQYSTVRFADGHQVELRKPTFTIEELGYGPMADNVMMSVRITPSMTGSGLVEAISETSLLANEDPNDEDGDGVSGRANRVWDVQKQSTSIGRLGWKAGVPTLKQQSAGAFNGDMGLTTSLFPEEPCTKAQKECLEAPGGNNPDVSDFILDKIVFYGRHLGVPMRRDARKPEVLKGKKLFNEVGCAKCHQPSFRTATMDVQSETAMTVIEREQSSQLIWPYSDFLLHDMGEGLADGRPEFLATGNEWKTPALWGIGLIQAMNKEAGFLHDGRARTLMEAILWHGGEAKASRDKVLKMNEQERGALLKFIESL